MDSEGKIIYLWKTLDEVMGIRLLTSFNDETKLIIFRKINEIRSNQAVDDIFKYSSIEKSGFL